METFLFMAILTMLVIAVISFIVLKKRWQFSIKLFLVGLIGFALPVMMLKDYQCPSSFKLCSLF